MSFFRGDRTFSPLLRHDPFTPFFPHSSFHSPLPLSRVFDSSPFYSPFSPFLTYYEEPRSTRYEGRGQSQPSSSSKAVEASPSQPPTSTSQSTPSQSQSKEVTNTQSNDSGVEKRHSGGRRHHQRPQQQMSLWSPFNGSPFHSSLVNSAFAPFAPFSQVMQALPEITLDMFSTPQAYSLHASVPGMEKKDIRVTVEDGVLTIQAERKESRRPANREASSSPSSSQASPSHTTNGATSGSQSTSDSQQSSAEMKYPTEDKEEKATTSTTTQSSSTPSASNSSTETSKESLPVGSDVSANGASNSTMEVENADDDDVNVHHVESFYGRVERSVQLPEDAKVDELTAHYENGILKIEIPRVEQKAKGRRIEIQ